MPTDFISYADRNPIQAHPDQLPWLSITSSNAATWLMHTTGAVVLVEGHVADGKLIADRECATFAVEATPGTIVIATGYRVQHGLFLCIAWDSVTRVYFFDARTRAHREVFRSEVRRASIAVDDRDAFVLDGSVVYRADGDTGALAEFATAPADGVLVAARDGTVFVAWTTELVPPLDDLDRVPWRTTIQRLAAHGVARVIYDEQCFLWSAVATSRWLYLSRSQMGIGGNSPHAIARIPLDGGPEEKLLERPADALTAGPKLVTVASPLSPDEPLSVYTNSIPIAPFVGHSLLRLPAAGVPTTLLPKPIHARDSQLRYTRHHESPLAEPLPTELILCEWTRGTLLAVHPDGVWVRYAPPRVWADS